MAKVNRVNIAITGDSKGLAAATDAATRDLRRLQAQSERTQKRIAGMRGGVNQAAESLAKLGVQSRVLGGAGGILGLAGMAAMGPAGLGLAAAALGIGAAGAVAGAGVSTIAGIPEQRRRAQQALEATRMDQRRRIEEFGLTQRLAEGLAMGSPTTGVAGGLGLLGGVGAGLGAANTPGGRALETILSQGPGAIGVFAGQRLGGVSETSSARAAMETVFGEGGQGVMNAASFVGDIMNTQSGPVAWMRDMALWWSK